MFEELWDRWRRNGETLSNNEWAPGRIMTSYCPMRNQESVLSIYIPGVSPERGKRLAFRRHGVHEIRVNVPHDDPQTRETLKSMGWYYCGHYFRDEYVEIGGEDWRHTFLGHSYAITRDVFHHFKCRCRECRLRLYDKFRRKTKRPSISEWYEFLVGPVPICEFCGELVPEDRLRIVAAANTGRRVGYNLDFIGEHIKKEGRFLATEWGGPIFAGQGFCSGRCKRLMTLSAYNSKRQEQLEKSWLRKARRSLKETRLTLRNLKRQEVSPSPKRASPQGGSSPK